VDEHGRRGPIELIWSPWNVEEIARHGLEPEEVDEAASDPQRAVRRNKRFRTAPAYYVIGSTSGGTIVTMILSPRGSGRYWPVTAWEADVVDVAAYHAAHRR